MYEILKHATRYLFNIQNGFKIVSLLNDYVNQTSHSHLLIQNLSKLEMSGGRPIVLKGFCYFVDMCKNWWIVDKMCTVEIWYVHWVMCEQFRLIGYYMANKLAKMQSDIC